MGQVVRTKWVESERGSVLGFLSGIDAEDLADLFGADRVFICTHEPALVGEKFVRSYPVLTFTSNDNPTKAVYRLRSHGYALV